MSPSELKLEIDFGLENLEKVHQKLVTIFNNKEIDLEVKTSALAYECIGYYNAIEHLIL